MLQEDREQGAGGMVRALAPGDVPALVALRRVAFQRSERSTPEALASFFRAVFLENPWRAPDLPSLVHENDRGDVTGFLGVLPRQMVVGGRAIRVAVGTQLMVSPEEHGLAGKRIARAFIEGPQDLCLADTANDAARRLWASVGGHTSPLLSMNWVRSLRPLRHGLQRMGSGAIASVLRTVAEPLCGVIDRMTTRHERAPGARHLALTAAGITEDQDRVLSDFELRPHYEPDSLDWLLARAAEKKQFGPLYSARLRDAGGRPAGWYLYHLDPAGAANVLQIAAGHGAHALALQSLFADAWERGAVSITGRVEPWLMPTLLATSGVYVYQGPWTLLYSRRRELTDMIDRGAGYLSRLDGEWWLSF